MEIVHAWQYCVFVFIAVMGMLQLIATCHQVKGMLFVRNKPVTLILSIAAIVLAYWWFFFRDNRIDTVMRSTSRFPDLTQLFDQAREHEAPERDRAAGWLPAVGQ